MNKELYFTFLSHLSDALKGGACQNNNFLYIHNIGDIRARKATGFIEHRMCTIWN